MKVFYTEDQKFEVRPWGGRMCFLATEDSAQSKLLGVTAVLRMGQGLTHSTHPHDDCDELIRVLNGEGSQLFQEEDGTEIRYDLHPDDLLYIAKNRVHRTDNLSKTDDLELFIINYFCDGQSDVHVKGFLPGACSTTQNILTPATCGSSTVNGESLTVAPGQTVQIPMTRKEGFVFAISGEGKVNGEVLPTHALAFFTKGEACSVENMSDATLRLFCMQAD